MCMHFHSLLHIEPYIEVSHATHINVQTTVFAFAWQMLPTNAHEQAGLFMCACPHQQAGLFMCACPHQRAGLFMCAYLQCTSLRQNGKPK